MSGIFAFEFQNAVEKRFVAMHRHLDGRVGRFGQRPQNVEDWSGSAGDKDATKAINRSRDSGADPHPILTSSASMRAAR